MTVNHLSLPSVFCVLTYKSSGEQGLLFFFTSIQKPPSAQDSSVAFPEVSKREGGVEVESSMVCKHTEEGFDWPERQIGGLEEVIREQSRRKFGPPKVISVNIIVFQGEIL